MGNHASLGGRAMAALCALLVGIAVLVAIGSDGTATPAAAEIEIPDPPPPCPPGTGDSAFRRCIFASDASDEAQLSVSPTVITLPEPYPSCVGGSWAGLPPTGRCQTLNFGVSLSPSVPYCGDAEPRTDCYVVHWGNDPLAIWYDIWASAGVFRYLVVSAGQACSGADLSCDRYFLVGSESEGLGRSGWLILSDPRVEIRKYPDPAAGYTSTSYRPEVAVYVEPEEEPPTASFNFTIDGDQSGIVRFTSTSTDPNDQPLTTHWDFGDGSTGSGETFAHRYAETGTYDVTLTVTNTDGASDTETTSVHVVVKEDVPLPLIVNSTGDAGDDDPSNGCDTGGTIGDDPECTLRAALETVTNDGGGEITFDIDAGGVPTITVGADPLPNVPGSTTIDGTSQAAGQVAIDGAGTDTLLTLTGPGTTVEGLVLDNASTAISVEGATGATITGNVIGADAAGMTAGSVGDGVTVGSGSNVVVSENVIAAGNGLIAANVADGAQFIENAVGVQKGGGAVLGETGFGILAVGPDAVVRGNTVHASLIGIGIVSAQASGAEVRGNRIGVAGAANVVLDGNGQGVRVDGAPDVVVAENVISSARDDVDGDIGAVVVTGGQQGYEEASGDGVRIVFNNHNGNEELDSPVTATNVTITDNVIGDSAVTGSDDESGATTGILAWDEPSNVTVRNNVIAGPERGVELYGGSGHSVLGNRIGIDASDAPYPVESVGVLLDGATNSAVGADGQGNTIHTALLGISLTGGSTLGSVAANEITASGEDDTTCIAIGDDSDNPSLQENTLIDCAQGIAIVDVVGGSAKRNVIQDPTVGLLIEGDATMASTNIVLGATLQAFIVSAEDVTLEDNLIGTASRTGAIQPFDGGGISFLEGSGTVSNNVIVGADGAAIAVNTSDVVTLRGNRLEDIGQRPIVAPNGPDEPTIDAAIRSVAPDDSTRTTLIVSGLPDGDAGQLEVFANDDCDPDGEAAKVLEVVRTKKLDRTTMIVQLIDRDDDNFTATYTDTTGTTSELSACAPIEDYPDSDGDGTVDPIDDLNGGAGDPTRGVVISDDAQILEVGTDSGQLTGVAAVGDPAPGGHPGVDLPYGTVTFTVEGLEPGGTANVTFLVIDGDPVQPDATYWKFAPPSPGTASSWFDFSFDENTGLGARTLDPIDVPDLGLRRPLQVSLQDGALGDADGFPNGTIVDPGAPGVPTPPAPPAPSPACSAAVEQSIGAGALVGAETLLGLPLGLIAWRRRRRHRAPDSGPTGTGHPTGPRRGRRVRSALAYLMVAGAAMTVLVACNPVKKAPPIC